MSSRLAGSPTTTVENEDPPATLDADRHAGSANGAGGDVLQNADADEHGQLNARRDAPVGGQAVLEGVMMRGVSNWAVAVRKPSAEQLAEGERSPEEAALGEIEVTAFPLESALKRHRVLRLPIIRGIVALGGSLVIGFRALEVSANAQLPPEPKDETQADANGVVEPAEPDEIPKAVWAGTVLVALVFAIVLFFLIPVGLTSLIKDQLGSSFLFWLIEGVVRTAIFLGYMLLLSRLRDLRRVFEYHGAEHKTISCFEAGLPLTPAHAQRFSRLHPRCGTSFLLVVMIVAIFVFAPIGLPAWYWLVATRILGVPLIAGISFELIKFAGRNRSRRWVRAVMWPGLKLQLLTTREPDLDQLAVAIAALEAVLERETPGALSAEDLVGVEVVA
ncbi:MAG: DUF1385 domain-containing protein [Solirubrobacterales bacterium]